MVRDFGPDPCERGFAIVTISHVSRTVVKS
jgi:hypothetical protein